METERICPNCRKPLPPDVPMGLCPECLIKSGFPTEGGAAAAAPAGGFVPPPVAEIARLFPQFEVLELIGKGGMGAVYKARQPALDRFVALKVLPPAVANDPGFAERFNREARALARLSHPNIVVVYDFGKAGDLHYLVMEFVDGANLREVERAGRLSSDQALAIVPQICEALQFAHNEGIVHRDIKPENLLLDKKGRVKITDFGIAKILGVTEGKASLTGARDVMGTPHYMAPEQIERPQTVDHRADIYSLGVVFYEMLTGELPLGKFAPPSKKVQVDVRLDEVVLHTLEKEPERRYQHASQVKSDVETIATTRQPPVIGAAAQPMGPGNRLASTLAPPPQPDDSSDKIILPALLLAFPFGVLGAHRFYVGKLWSGLLQLGCLAGCVFMVMICASRMAYNAQLVPEVLLAALICGCLAWAAIDWILIFCKVFTDGEGRRLTRWWHNGARAPRPPFPAPPAQPPVTQGPPKTAAAEAPQTPMAGSPPKIARVTPMSNAVMIAPAVALLVTGFWKLFTALPVLSLVLFGRGPMPLNSIFAHIGFRVAPFHWPLAVGMMTSVFSVIPALAIIFGAIEMVRLRSYAWAVTSAILAILFCSIIGVPSGIWALVVLLLPGTRAAFASANGRPTTTFWPWILGATGVALLLLTMIFTWLSPSAHYRTVTHSFVPMVPQMQQVQPLAPMAPPIPVIPNPPVPATPAPEPPMPATSPEVLAAQLQSAEEELERVRQEQDVGRATAEQVASAQDAVALLQAQMVGDPILIAQIKLASARRNLSIQKQRYDAGVITRAEYDKAQANVKVAQLELNEAKAAVQLIEQAAPGGAFPPAAVALPGPAMPAASATAPSSATVSISNTAAGTPPLYQWYIASPAVSQEVSNDLSEVTSDIAEDISNIAVSMTNIAETLQSAGGVVATNMAPEVQAQLQSAFAEAQRQLVEAQKQFQDQRANSNPGMAQAEDAIRFTQSQISNVTANLGVQLGNGAVPREAWQQAQDEMAKTRAQLQATEDSLLMQSRQMAAAAVGTLAMPPGSSGTISVYERADANDSTDFYKAFSAAPGGQLTMRVDRGDIDVHTGADDQVTVEVVRGVTGTTGAEAVEILKEEQITIERNGNGISITSQDPPALHRQGFFGINGRNLEVHYKITVPEQYGTQLQTAGGNIGVKGVHSRVNIHTSGGNLDCEDMGGDIEGRTDGGNIVMQKCAGPLRVRTSGGNITIDDFTGPSVQAATDGGSVEALFLAAPKADCDLHTSGGNMKVQLPADVAVALDAHTDGGTVRADFPVLTEGKPSDDTLTGTIGGGGPMLKLETSGGNIEIVK